MFCDFSFTAKNVPTCGLEQCCSEIINIVPVSVTHVSRLEWVKKIQFQKMLMVKF
ncbi:unnamed protein product [Acanthoscelides obtectus]|uniref:Uncharacterized protein n=1 Tax=Acanthoscelides obtectus TaxID=200917 RepID=A0A9P0LLM1_ACAOB|nr:unnamed protein product [Acanthoscelides obtectus]CAK1650237.1 hypothetical protein AOBTE_LOCUS16708 [Acanthoscelides obtectus]